MTRYRYTHHKMRFRMPLRFRLRAKVRRAGALAKGQYEGGGCVVTSRHWWSREDRRTARVAAAILEHEAGKIRKRVIRAMIFGESYVYPKWVDSLPEGPE